MLAVVRVPFAPVFLRSSTWP